MIATTRPTRRRPALLGAIHPLGAVPAALVRAFVLLGFGTPKTGDRVTVEGTVAEDGIAGLVLNTSHGRLWLAGIASLSPTVEPGDKVRVEGEFFEFSIHHLSGVRVEQVERL